MRKLFLVNIGSIIRGSKMMLFHFSNVSSETILPDQSGLLLASKLKTKWHSVFHNKLEKHPHKNRIESPWERGAGGISQNLHAYLVFFLEGPGQRIAQWGKPRNVGPSPPPHNRQAPTYINSGCSGGRLLPHSFLTAKHLFPRFFTFFYAFLNLQNLNMIAMPNSHLVLHKETLKQHFEI